MDERAPLFVTQLLLEPLVDPVIDGLVPEPAVLRLEHPVAFVGEVQHFGRNVQALKGGEELESFGDVEAVIALSVDDEGGRLEVRRILMGRPAAIHLAVGVGRAFEFPFVEP
jgi:hypothetical protein